MIDDKQLEEIERMADYTGKQYLIQSKPFGTLICKVGLYAAEKDTLQECITWIHSKYKQIIRGTDKKQTGL